MRTIASILDNIGGDYATTELPEDYVGACSLQSENPIGTFKTLAVFPSFDEACTAASYAIAPDGGYSNVTVAAAPTERVTHQTWDDWAF